MILNSPYISGSLTVTGNTNLMGALTVTGSLAGTATSSSFAYTASSAVSAYTAASAVNATTALTASYATSFTVGGTLTAQTLVVQTITSSVSFITGSTRFGSLSTNTHTFTGSLYITGSVGINAASSFRFNGVADTSHAVGYDSTVDGAFLRGQNGIRLLTGTGGGTEIMRISSSGNVGIGTTTPDTLLTVNGTTGTKSFSLINSGGGTRADFTITENTGLILNVNEGATTRGLYVQTGGVDKFTILAGGNVGIGTTSPSQVLHISNASNYVGALINGSNAPQLCFAQGSGTSPNWKVGISGNDGNAFSISSGSINADMLTILRNGNVGIGTFAPSSLLHISGQMLQGLNQFRTSSGTQAVSTTADIFRFLNGADGINNGCYSAIFHVWVTDNNTGANAYSATYGVQTTSNGQTNAAFTVLSSVTRGTSPVSSLNLISDGAGGAAKVSLTTSATPTAGVTYQCSAMGIF